MTIDRDDPEGRRLARSESAEEPSRSAADAALCEKARGREGAVLRRQGFSPRAVDAILDEACEDLRIYGDCVGDKEAFLTRRMRKRAAEYCRLRGIDPDREQEPDLLLILRTAEALETLSRDKRVALKILYHHGGNFNDVAAELETSVVYVRRLVQKALEELRKELRRGRPQRGPWT